MTTERSTGDGATTAERYGATTNALPAAGAEALPATDALHLDGLDRDDLAEWLETMVLIREFETACDPLALAGKVIGGIHSSAGQEAVAVGAMRALLPEDKVAGSTPLTPSRPRPRPPTPPASWPSCTGGQRASATAAVAACTCDGGSATRAATASSARESASRWALRSPPSSRTRSRRRRVRRAMAA